MLLTGSRRSRDRRQFRRSLEPQSIKFGNDPFAAPRLCTSAFSSFSPAISPLRLADNRPGKVLSASICVICGFLALGGLCAFASSRLCVKDSGVRVARVRQWGKASQSASEILSVSICVICGLLALRGWPGFAPLRLRVFALKTRACGWPWFLWRELFRILEWNPKTR